MTKPRFWADVKDPQAFADYMETVDERLRRDGVDIVARPIHAFGIVSAELKVKFTMPSPISTRIHEWFELRYGPRLNFAPVLGSMLVEVRGDAFAVRYPLVIGTVRVNPFSLVLEATPGLFLGIPEPELANLASVIVAGFEASIKLASIPHPPLPDGAAAVSHLVGRPPDAGLSKWSSQQALEKLLNEFVLASGSDPKRRRRTSARIHDLLPLVELAEGLSLPTLDRALVALVECDANARYPGRVAVSTHEAVVANQASLQLCGVVAEHWPSRGKG